MNNELMSQQINEIANALSKFQGSVPFIKKGKKAKITSKTGSSFSYQYADLPEILNSIQKSLTENGLAVCQPCMPGQIVTLLLHSSGQWIKSIISLSTADLKTQERGGEITYYRRYALTSILGISADDDDDAEAANHAQQAPHKSYTAPAEVKTIAAKIAEDVKAISAAPKLSKEQIEEIVELVGDDIELGHRIVEGYAKKDLSIKEIGDIPAAFFPAIVEKLKKIKA